MKKKYVGIIFGVFLLLGAAGVGGYRFYQYQIELAELKKQIALRQSAWFQTKQNLDKRVQEFKGLSGVVIEDLRSGWVYKRNSSAEIPAASVIKIPIMAACFFAQSENKLDLNQSIILRTSNKVSGSGVLKNVPAGEQFTVSQLIELMIAYSDNTATNILIDILGFDYCNQFFKNQGLSNTLLSRKMMHFKKRRQGVENFTSADDTALLLKKMYSRKFVSAAVSDQCMRFLLRQHYRDRIPAKLPQGIVCAHKTGLERNVCHDAGIVYTPTGNFLISVLTKNASSSRQAKDFISDIALIMYSFMTAS